jgi:hypothetical protein
MAALAQTKMDDMKGMDMAKKPAAAEPMVHKAVGTVKKSTPRPESCRLRTSRSSR